MRIGIDARVLAEGNGGVFVYAKNIISRLAALGSGHEIHLFANQYKRVSSGEIARLAALPNVTVHQYRFPNKFLNASFRFWRWPNIDELVGGCDVLFFPSMMYGSVSAKTKTVLTMHDLSYEFFPEFFTVRQQLWHRLMDPKALCQKADRIIAVSESTAKDVVNHYAIPEKKIATIHSGIDASFRAVVDRATLASAAARYGLGRGRYILQAGTLNPRKNGEATLAAFERIRRLYPDSCADVRLLFLGHAGWKTGSLLSAVRASAFRDSIHIVRDVSAHDLPALYSLASVAAYPSFYEGFGFPILEAFACGVPVVTSATSSLSEIAGDGALLVNPYRVDELSEALFRVLSDPETAKGLRSRGLARTVHFSWEKAARETLKAIESI